MSSIVAPLFPSCLFQMLFPICHLIVSCLSCKCDFHRPRISSRCALRILPVIFHLTPQRPVVFQTSPPIVYHNFSIAFQLFPSCLPDLVFRLYPLALKLSGCKAGVIVSGYWCPTLWISLIRMLVSGFPFMCLPLWLLVSRSPHASLHWFNWSLSLPTCLPAWLSTASGVRSADVSLHLFPFICFPLSLVVFPFWVVLSGSPGVSLWVFSCMCLPLWLVVSGCPDVFSLLSLGSHHFSLTVFVPDSSVPQVMLYSGTVCFFPCLLQSVSHFICLPFICIP